MKADWDTSEFLAELKSIVGTNWMETDRETFLGYLTDETAQPPRPKPASKTMFIKLDTPKNTRVSGRK